LYCYKNREVASEAILETLLEWVWKSKLRVDKTLRPWHNEWLRVNKVQMVDISSESKEGEKGSETNHSLKVD